MTRSRSLQMPATMKKVLISPITVAIVLILIMTIPLLKYAQFREDDHIQLGVLSGKLDYPWMSPFNLYGFISGNPGYIPAMVYQGPFTWEMAYHGQEKVNFFRPLSSLLIALTYQVFHLHPVGYMLHNILWYIAAAIFLVFLLKRIYPRPDRGSWHLAVYIAVIMFVIFPSNTFTVMWNAARWIIVAVTLCLAGLLAHIKWREEQWLPGRFLSPLLFLLALLTGEISLAVMAYWLAYELFARSDALRERLLAISPVAVMVMIYLAFYKMMGYGTAGIGDYLDPINNFAAYISALPGKVLAIMSELFFGGNSSRWYFPEQRLNVILLGGSAVVLIGLLLFPIWKSSVPHQRRHILWILFGTLGSLLPLTARVPSSHVMLIPLIGSVTFIGFIIHFWVQRIKEAVTIPRVLAMVACGGLVFLLFFRPLPSWNRFGQGWQESHRQLEQFHRQSVLNQILPHQKAIFLNFNNWALDFHAYYYRKLHDLPMPETWWRLTSSAQPRRYYRVSEDTLEMEIIDNRKGEGTKMIEKEPGDFKVLSLPGIQVTVLKTAPQGPIRVRFQFEHSISDERYRFLVWREGVLNFQALPAVGESLAISP